MKHLAAVMIGGTLMGGMMFGGCQPSVRVEPIEVKPIHVTVDVNIKVDRELDNFFDFEDELKPVNQAKPVTPVEKKPTGGEL